MSLRPPVKFQWRGNHHSYYGVFFLAFGLFNIYMGWGNGSLSSLLPLWGGLATIGSYMIVDDVIEHNVTADTPLRILYRILFKVNE